MSAWNYIGWVWIIWTMFNEGYALMVRAYIRNPSIMTGVFSWLLSALAIWAALS